MNKVEVKNTSPWFGNKAIVTKHVKLTQEVTDIVDYKLVQRSVKTGDGDYDFLLVDEVIEVGRRNRRKELNKYAPDVGAPNVIAKLAKQGINAGDGRFTANTGFVDATKLPQDLESLTALSKELDPLTSKAWAAIPAELKKNLNMEDFAKRYNTQMLQDFIKSKYVKPQSKTEVKTEVKTEDKKEGDK